MFIVPAQPPQRKEGVVEAFLDQLDNFVENKLTELDWLRGKYEIIEALPRKPLGEVSKGVLHASG